MVLNGFIGYSTIEPGLLPKSSMYLGASEHHRQFSRYCSSSLCSCLKKTLFLSSPEVRQLAAVEMRKRVAAKSGSMWTLLPQDERTQIKEKFPALCLAEAKYVLSVCFITARCNALLLTVTWSAMRQRVSSLPSLPSK